MHSAQPGLLNRCVRRHKVAIVVASVASVCLVNSAHLYWPLHFCVCLYISVCLLSCELYIHRCVLRDKVAIVVGSVTSVSGSITASPRPRPHYANIFTWSCSVGTLHGLQHNVKCIILVSLWSVICCGILCLDSSNSDVLHCNKYFVYFSRAFI